MQGRGDPGGSGTFSSPPVACNTCCSNLQGTWGRVLSGSPGGAIRGVMRRVGGGCLCSRAVPWACCAVWKVGCNQNSSVSMSLGPAPPLQHTFSTPWPSARCWVVSEGGGDPGPPQACAPSLQHYGGLRRAWQSLHGRTLGVLLFMGSHVRKHPWAPPSHGDPGPARVEVDSIGSSRP